MKKFTTITRVFRISALFSLLVFLLLPDGNRACAQDRGNPNWYARVVPYLWFSNVDGNQTIGDLYVPVGDTVLNRNAALRFEIGKGRLRGLIHLFRSHRDNSAIITRIGNPTDSTAASYAFTWFTAEMFAAVQIGPFERRYGVELYAGGRYVRHEQKLKVSGTSTAAKDATEAWIEPVIGWRLFLKLSHRFWSTISTDIAGFGVGSDFTWTRGSELGFNVIKPIDLTLRYNYLEVQYDNGKEGSERYIWDEGVQQGWFFGVVFKI